MRQIHPEKLHVGILLTRRERSSQPNTRVLLHYFDFGVGLNLDSPNTAPAKQKWHSRAHILFGLWLLAPSNDNKPTPFKWVQHVYEHALLSYEYTGHDHKTYLCWLCFRRLKVSKGWLCTHKLRVATNRSWICKLTLSVRTSIFVKTSSITLTRAPLETKQMLLFVHLGCN